jgi:tRNA wybutosine-synthesizing protein 4
MDPQHADRIIQWAADTFHTGGFLTYEQIRPNDAFGKMMMQNLQTRNIELKGILAFPDLEAQQARYKDRGWSHVTAVDMQSVYDKSISDAEAIRYILRKTVIKLTQNLCRAESARSNCWTSWRNGEC